MAQKKLILVILDGLNYQASQYAGWLHAFAREKGRFYKMKTMTPALSRPMYDFILSGKSPVESGVHNKMADIRGTEGIFHLASQKGLLTAAAAYYWISELYIKTPFDLLTDAHQENTSPIHFGRYYCQDHYPDLHLFQDAAHIIQKHNPDFLLLHSMNIDDVGHKFGGSSKEYNTQVLDTDTNLAPFLKKWLEIGYDIIVTADHGMNSDGLHSGPGECEVPFVLLGNGWSYEIDEDSILQQQYMASWLCKHLGLEPYSYMQKFEKQL